MCTQAITLRHDEGSALIRILVAAHLPLVRRGLVASLGAEPDLRVVADVGNVEDVVPAVVAGAPDTAVIDLDLPGGGLAVAATLAGPSTASWPSPRCSRQRTR